MKLKQRGIERAFERHIPREKLKCRHLEAAPDPLDDIKSAFKERFGDVAVETPEWIKLVDELIDYLEEKFSELITNPESTRIPEGVRILYDFFKRNVQLNNHKIPGDSNPAEIFDNYTNPY